MGERRCALLFVTFSFYFIQAQPQGYDFINPFIGTDGQGFGIGENVPGACRPFGFVRASPDTSQIDFPIPAAWEHNGGYYWGDQYINCFSHTHLAGAGLADYGTIALMPLAKISPQNQDIWHYGYRSPFSHENEKAAPGFYSVFLDGPQVLVEITTTQNVGVHRYTWLGPNEKSILFPISHSIVAKYPDGCRAANITIDVANQEVRGYIQQHGGLTGRIGDYKSYFVARFDQPFDNGGVWNADQLTPYRPNANGSISTTDPGNLVNIDGIGGYVSFSHPNRTVTIYVGVSSIGIAQARRNIQAQANGIAFDIAHQQSKDAWSLLLSQVHVEADAFMNATLIKFYSAFFRVLTVPSSFGEADGLYMGFDGKVHRLEDGYTHFFTDMSIWDIVRTQMPWLGFFLPDIMKGILSPEIPPPTDGADVVHSLQLMYQQGEDLPKWPIANGYGECMVGAHAIVLLVDAYLKGIPMDEHLMYNAAKQVFTSHQKHAGIDVTSWHTYGYIPNECSATLEIAYDASALATMALELGYHEDYEAFYNQSKHYKSQWNPQIKFFCPKSATGVFDCPEGLGLLNVFDKRYVEGDAWHYRFYAPGDPEGLIELFGSEDYFISQLDEFMSRAEWDPFTVLPNPYYWAGNEPGLLSPFLFNFAGRMDLNSRYVHWIRANRYTPRADGLPGNDDYGTMSAWYLWTSFGLYPIGGTQTFLLTTPAFRSLTLKRPGGSLVVDCHNFAPENFYITKVTVNDRLVDMKRPVLHWNDIKNSTHLQFWLSQESPFSEGKSTPTKSSHIDK